MATLTVQASVSRNQSQSSRDNNSKSFLRPFLRWAGGKTHLLNVLLSFVPDDLDVRTYHEPFVGAGTLFFALQPARAFLSDANEHLITCYTYVRDAHAAVYRFLEKHLRSTSEQHYYLTRKKYNEACPSAAQAARFIYLNKACFNGIFRVNTKGEFNVPYGWKEPPALPSFEHLKRASHALKSIVLRCADFMEVAKAVQPGDFIYLDPPYPPLNGTAYFTHYTADRFGEKNQEAVADLARELHSRGCLVLISNADTRKIRQMYKGFEFTSVRVTRFLTCKKKHVVRELIIRNYSTIKEFETK